MTDRADERPMTELDRGDSRRQALAKIGVGAAVVWAAPLVVTLPGSAAAVGSAQPGTTTSTLPETTTTSTTTTTTTQPVQTPLDVSFPAGWEMTTTGTFGPADYLGYLTSGGRYSHWLTKDAVGGPASVTLSLPVPLVGGQTYTFVFELDGYSVHPVPQTLTASIGTAVTTFSTDEFTGAFSGVVRSLTFTPDTTGTYVLSFVRTLVEEGPADSLLIWSPTATWSN